MTGRLRYVELRSLGRDLTAVGTASRRWFRVPVSIDTAADLIRACDSSSPVPDGASGSLARQLSELLISEGSLVPQEVTGPPAPTAVLTGTPSLCARVRRADGSGIFQGAGQYDGKAGSGGAQPGILVALTDRTDPAQLRAIANRCGQAGAWAPFRLDMGCGWFGPVFLPGGDLTVEDLLGRWKAADTSPRPVGPPQRFGAWNDPSDSDLAWMVSVAASLIARYFAGDDGQLHFAEVELDPAGFSVRHHPVLPLPLATASQAPARDPGMPPGVSRPAAVLSAAFGSKDLADERTGIVTRFTEVQHHPSIPRQLRTVHAHVASMRRVTGWLTDPIAAGTSFASWDAARQAALGEAVERYCGNIINPSLLRFASWQELADARELAVDPERLVLFSEGQYRTPGFPFVPLTRQLPIHWVKGRSLTQDRPAWLPASLVYANWYVGPYESTPHTNNPFYPGLAAGPSLEFALTAAMQEVIERHITMVWWANAQPLPAVRLTPALASLWPAGRTPLRAWLIHLDNEFSVPVMAGVVENPADNLLTIGFGARPDPEQAAFKAFAEALTLQDGARDLLRPGGGYRQAVERGDVCGAHVKPWRADRRYLDDYRTDFRDVADLMCQLQIALDPRAAEKIRPWVQTPPDRSFDDLPALSGVAIDHYRDAVEGKGYEVFYADITTRDVASTGMRVVRVLIPGLVPNFAAAFPFQGLGRLRQVAVELGWRQEPLAEDEINLFPMPHA